MVPVPITPPNPEYLSMVAGGVLSLALSYIPGLRVWFGRLDPVGKRLLMGMLLFITTLTIIVWRCTESNSLAVCLELGTLRSVVTSFVVALMANQAVHRITVPSTSSSSQDPVGRDSIDSSLTGGADSSDRDNS